jgi:hypothetical protein
MKTYPIGGAAIGIAQVIDAVVLFKNNGACESVSIALSSIEFIWAIVSLVVLIRVKHKATRLLAFAFFAYNVFGWLLAIFVVPQATSVVVPLWYVVLGGIFGLAYGASSVYVAKQP